MFYEGRINTIFKIDKDEILSVVSGDGSELKHVKRKDGTQHNATFYSDVLFVFDHNEKKYALANDASGCEGIGEIAIIDFDNMMQIESLTIEWTKGDKLAAILGCCDEPITAKKLEVVFDKDGNVTKQPKTYFTCSCCGEGFKSTSKEQAKHDQDFGYGYCSNCE
jgi:hypothetical protein